MIVLAIGAVTVGLLAAAYWLLLSSFSQVLGAFPYRGATTERVVALTFDDGPNEPYTSQIAAVLAEYQVRATFFQVGCCVQRFPETTAALVRVGHVVGNHSQSHRARRYVTQPGFGWELDAAQAQLKKVVGRRPALFRPPWLWRQPWLLRSARRRGLQPVSGVFGDMLEPLQPSGAHMARRALAKVRPGIILIFHDGYNGNGARRAATVDAVKIVVPALLAQGYRFVTVDELLKVPAYQPDPHQGSRRRSHF